MKIIDLLNNIANGKKVPTKIKFRNNIFRYSGCNYYCDEMKTTLFNIYSLSILNEKVEIIEENNKIEKFTEYELKHSMVNEYILGIKINELIDKINESEDK